VSSAALHKNLSQVLKSLGTNLGFRV
jgi:hypothetical protein